MVLLFSSKEVMVIFLEKRMELIIKIKGSSSLLIMNKEKAH